MMVGSIPNRSIYAQAQMLARHFLAGGIVKKVWLFGSVSKGQDSFHDIDLLLGVEQDLFYTFIDELNLAISDPALCEGKEDPLLWWRLDIGKRLIGMRSLPGGICLPIDLFLLPEDWEMCPSKLVDLTISLQKRFVEKIAKTARLYDSLKNEFAVPKDLRV